MLNLRRFLVLVACAVLAIGAAACSNDNNNSSNATPTAPTCTISIVQPTTTFGPEGGSGTVAVTAVAGCAWTSTSSAAFLTITQGATGSGNGSVVFAVAVNTGADRTATLTVAGSSIAITQRAAGTPAPTGTLAPPSARSPIGGVAVDPGTPTLIINNAAATGTVGTVTYRFEISDQSSFPSDPVRTFVQDGVAQGSGTTSWVVNHTLGANVLWYWHARATNGTSTTAYSATETFTTGNPCTYTLSPSSATALGTGGTGSVTVTAANSCAWTAVSNAAFVTVTTGASGTGGGTVNYSVAANSGPAARTGTITIAGQTFTITQSGAGGLTASFVLLDPATQASPTTECRFRSGTGLASTCMVQSTATAAGSNTIVSYAWTVQYTYVTIKVITGTNQTLSFTDVCGQMTSTDDGVAQPLLVSLTVTDSLGATATATAGSGSQPALSVRLFTCGL